MKILVAGGAGFVGTNLIKRLLKEQHEVISVDNYSTGFKENHQDGCTYYDRDLSKSINWWNLCDDHVNCEVHHVRCQIEPVDLIFNIGCFS